MFEKTATGKALLAEGEARGQQEAVVRFLRARFGDVPAAVVDAVRAVEEPEALGRLIERAALAPSLRAFRSHLAPRRRSSKKSR